MKMSVTGVAALVRGLRQYEKRAAKAFNKAMKPASKLLVATAKPLAPIDTGALRASGVWWVEGTGFSSVAIVGFGGPVDGFYDDWGREKVPAEYAVYQHENPWANFYLERAVDEKYYEISNLFYTELAKA